VEQIAISKQVATVEIVKDIVNRFLTDDNDSWELRHFRTRIDTYYALEERQYALNLLDVLADQEKPIGFENLFNLLKSKMVTEDAETARSTLTLLQLDHYITKNLDGTYLFRFPIIRRWWRLERGI